MYFIFGAAGLLLLLGDFAVKLLVRSRMRVFETIPVIQDVFHITYVQNTGAAFSILSGQKWLLLAVTSALVLGILCYVFWKRPKNITLLLALTLIVSGGLGNLIDRALLGFVVDYFDFRLIHFAVFNLADVFVVCGTVLLGIYLIFLEDKEKHAKEN